MFTKKLFTASKFEKCFEANNSGRRKKFQPEKIKIEGVVAFISKKNSLNHISETQYFHMQSLPTANFSLVWPNFRTPYYVYAE